MSMLIRAYRPEDLPAVRALIEGVLAEFGFAHAVGGLERDLAEIAARYGRQDAGFWVAEEDGDGDGDGVILGTVAVRSMSIPGEPGTCELKRLYLRPDRRGKGLGQALYDHAEAFARAAGYRRIWLDSSRRFDRAHRLYERNGFVLLERLDNDWEDNVYEKRLA